MANVNTLLDDHVTLRYESLWKLDRALRTETTINDAYDFGVGRRLANLDALREIGRGINRRLIELERDAQRCTPAAATFEALVVPTGPRDARAPGLRFGDPRVVALFGALADFRWAAGAIRSRPLRELVEAHLGVPYGPRQMAYDLRRLVRKGLLERLPRSHRYRLTELGRRLVLLRQALQPGHLSRPLPAPPGPGAQSDRPRLEHLGSPARPAHRRCSPRYLRSSAKLGSIVVL